ncbi:MAG: hypothetical protein VYE64_07925 [Planctomycetota bacterium]|nr:hypothetical protein [Planctomycetota bacterium]
MKISYSCLVWFILSFFVVPAALFGQDRDNRERDGGERGKREYSREQIEGYLKRLDRNESQVLELDEMSDRTKRWLGGLGLDTSRPIKLSTAMRSVDSDKAAKAKAERRKQLEANRLVPGFGVEKESSEDVVPVPDFSGTAPIAPGSLEEKYGKGVMQQVNSTLERYDTNKSGTLNSQEIAAARWGRPTPQESDTNKDGRLTRSELAERYAARSRSSSSRSSSSKSDESKDRDSSSSRRSSSRDSDSRSSSRSSSSRSSGGNDLKSRMERYDSEVKSRYEKDKPGSEKSGQSKSNAYNSGSDRYKRYADALLKQYDKDKDNKLSKAEVKSMRRPPSQADSNGDGMITRDELIEAISNPKSSSSSSSSSEERTSRSSSRSRFSDRSRSSSDSRSSSSSSSRSSSKSVSFSGNDTNKDGQLQMHEYAKDWDAETLEEFKRKDKNNDGIITRSEWTGR